MGDLSRLTKDRADSVWRDTRMGQLVEPSVNDGAQLVENAHQRIFNFTPDPRFRGEIVLVNGHVNVMCPSASGILLYNVRAVGSGVTSDRGTSGSMREWTPGSTFPVPVGVPNTRRWGASFCFEVELSQAGDVGVDLRLEYGGTYRFTNVSYLQSRLFIQLLTYPV